MSFAAHVSLIGGLRPLAFGEPPPIWAEVWVTQHTFLIVTPPLRYFDANLKRLNQKHLCCKDHTGWVVRLSPAILITPIFDKRFRITFRPNPNQGRYGAGVTRQSFASGHWLRHPAWFSRLPR